MVDKGKIQLDSNTPDAEPESRICKQPKDQRTKADAVVSMRVRMLLVKSLVNYFSSGRNYWKRFAAAEWYPRIFSG